MSALNEQHCKPCEGGVSPLKRAAAEELLAELEEGWAIDEAGVELDRTFRFKDYHQTIAFVNQVAMMTHQEDHHPDLEVGYNRCRVRYSTHAIGGLSQNDFICAARIDRL